MALTYSNIIEPWEESKCYQTPSAIQGWLTGYLATGARLSTENWLLEACNYLEVEAIDHSLEPLLIKLKDEVLEALLSEEMEYELLLPDEDEADVDDQVDSLAQWSKGFLDGLGASGRIKGRPDSDLMEVLRDLDAFSQAEVEDINDPENTQLFLQLVEHARVSALTVFYIFNKPNTKNQTKLH